MKTEDIAKEPPHRWVPMTDPVAVAALTKLSEEAGELISAAQRCIMQGIDECEPITGKPNRQWLQEELADVQAMIQLIREGTVGPLDQMGINERWRRKFHMKLDWLRMLGYGVEPSKYPGGHTKEEWDRIAAANEKATAHLEDD